MNVSFLRLRESSGWRMLWAPGMRRRRPARELRLAVDCLPLQTRTAMLQGIDANRIIVGAYTDRQGGVCPMLAAHRNGGRTSPAGFAPARGCYTPAPGGARPAPHPAGTTLPPR